MYARKNIKNPWEGYIEPFALSDNVYFVGTFQSSVHLIDTGDGLVLIDSGYRNALYLVIDSIHRLGFDPKDIKYIVTTHWHDDHTEGHMGLVNLSGCKTVISEIDAPEVIKRGLFVPDITLRDGDRLSCGNTVFEFMLTPGHTRGTVSLFFNTSVDGRPFRAGMFGGAGANSLNKSFPTYYEGCREDYLASIDRLLKERVDIFLGNHCWNNDTEQKGKILRDTGENRFLDPKEWSKFLEFCKKRCLEVCANNP